MQNTPKRRNVSRTSSNVKSKNSKSKLNINDENVNVSDNKGSNFGIKNITNMKKLLLLATISIFLSACASTEKPIPEYKLIPNQTTLKINHSLYHQNSISNQQK